MTVAKTLKKQAEETDRVTADPPATAWVQFEKVDESDLHSSVSAVDNVKLCSYCTAKCLSREISLQPFGNMAVKSAFDIVEILATVVNESSAEHTGRDRESPCSGLKFAERLANRTFSLSTGQTFVDAERIRNFDINIFAFNVSTLSMQVRFVWNKC